jgi:hypothetical protein
VDDFASLYLDKENNIVVAFHKPLRVSRLEAAPTLSFRQI